MKKYYINSFPFGLEEVSVGELDEAVDFVYFSVVEEKGKLFLIDLVGDHLSARVEVSHFDRDATYTSKAIKNNFGPFAFVGNILGKRLRRQGRPCFFLDFDPFIEPIKKLIAVVPKSVELIIVIFQAFLFFGLLQRHLLLELLRIRLKGERCYLHENMLAVRANGHEIVLSQTANGKMHFVHRAHSVVVTELNCHRLSNSFFGEVGSLSAESGLPFAVILPFLERFAHLTFS